MRRLASPFSDSLQSKALQTGSGTGFPQLPSQVCQSLQAIPKKRSAASSVAATARKLRISSQTMENAI